MNLTSEIRKEIIDSLNKANSKEEIIEVLKKYSDYKLEGKQLGIAFEKLYVDEDGFSPAISMDELLKLHSSYYTSNGSTWCRTNQGYLGRKYIIQREIKGKHISKIKIDGKNTKLTNQAIRADIVDEISKRRCAILDISTNIECDHKDGLKDDWRLNSKDQQQLDDFQALCKTANDAKRQHCKKCKETGKRYDAKNLGYSESYILGNANSKTCKGCYWYDPNWFNKKISEKFEKSDK